MTKAILKSLAGICALAVSVSGPLGPALAHEAVHAIAGVHEHHHEGAAHSHEHDGDAHHHEFLPADATPAALTSAPSLGSLRAGRGQATRLFAASTSGASALSLLGSFDTGPPRPASSLLLSRGPSDRAPPA